MDQDVLTAAQLTAAVGDRAVRRIVVHGEISGAPGIRLAPGQELVGAGDGAAVVFIDGTDGVVVTRDNTVSGLQLRASPARRAIVNDHSVDDLGTVRLADVTAVGQVRIVASGAVRAGHVSVDRLHVAGADTRSESDRPELLGVSVLQGAFTLWNQQPDVDVVVTADLRGISAGRDGTPVRGSGVFAAGAGRAGGQLEVDTLETGPVFTDGGIPDGSRDVISGAVFVVHGCRVREVRNLGPVTTYGTNDMALGNWGVVGTWTAHAPVTTQGRSGVGFVNFGTAGTLRVAAAIETHGTGGRGFNVYPVDGTAVPTVGTAEFERITTRGDAATGIQVAQSVGRLVVRGGVHTHGGAGESLVWGVLTRTLAHALSVQEGGRIDEIEVGGALTSAGADVAAVDVRGVVGTMRAGQGVHAAGAHADALRIDGGRIVLHDTDVSSADGAAVRLSPSAGAELREVTASGSPTDIVIEQTKGS